MEIARTLLRPDGATLAYRLWRPGRPRRLIVLIHGLASNLTRWAEFVATTRLRESWDLLRLDLRGFGGSLYRGRVGLDEWCRDLAAILDAEGPPRAVLVGHCLGANVALHFAARYPAATLGLVLIEPMFRQALTGSLRRATRLRPLMAALVQLVRGFNTLGLHRRRLETLDLQQLDRDARAAIAAAGPEAFPEARYGSPLEDLKSAPTAVYLAGLLALTEPLPDLSVIRTPALALLSRGGRFGDPAVTARILADLPRCETRMLEARHWIPTECPIEMRQAIEAWCDRLLASDAPDARTPGP
ncbi:MAG TPA: alpha/beta hydrolase [Methylomirabilota bacterium]|nr:alpha/beta hydrolase [Methylomirabilota bacterium]